MLHKVDSGGEQLFRALKFLKRPTAMVVFPRETHELSRTGEPWHRIERLDHIVGWFDQWIMGVLHPEYDARPRSRWPNLRREIPTAQRLSFETAMPAKISAWRISHRYSNTWHRNATVSVLNSNALITHCRY
jgi:hypothetical protein